MEISYCEVPRALQRKVLHFEYFARRKRKTFFQTRIRCLSKIGLIRIFTWIVSGFSRSTRIQIFQIFLPFYLYFIYQINIWRIENNITTAGMSFRSRFRIRSISTRIHNNKNCLKRSKVFEQLKLSAVERSNRLFSSKEVFMIEYAS